MKSTYIFIRGNGNGGNHKIIDIDSDDTNGEIRDALAWAELESEMAPEMVTDEWVLEEVFEDE